MNSWAICEKATQTICNAILEATQIEQRQRATQIGSNSNVNYRQRQRKLQATAT